MLEGCVNFYFESWPGATPRSFLPMAANAARRGRPYDWVLLIGGRNSGGINGEEIQTMRSVLFAYCSGHLIRKRITLCIGNAQTQSSCVYLRGYGRLKVTGLQGAIY